MNLGDEVDLEDYVSRPDKISAAEISAICQEAGMHAVSEAGQARWVMVGAQAGRGLDVATMSLSLIPRSTGHACSQGVC
jgi:SpoVK/Ycf46/Vps4 family AAA+-type ATPase